MKRSRGARNRCRVLVVDDTPEIRQLVRFTLELDGRFEIVGEAEDGATAIDLTDSKDPDAVVLDLAMPVMDGLQAIPEIRRISPDTKILVLSGFDARRTSDEAIERGAHAYVEKGENISELASLLADLCGEVVSPA
jgi:DNA-binding NarL/FixJ family response regulator